MTASADNSSSALERLRDALRPTTEEVPAARVSTGAAELDRLLPGGGLARGGLVEWLFSGLGAGAATLAWIVAREACETRGAVVVIDRRGEFYPPAATAWGVSCPRIVLVRTRTDEDALWAIEQALRCRGVAAVWGALPRVDDIGQRRLQLAAESGGTLGLFLRSIAARGQPSWADVQFGVEPRPARTDESRRLRVEVLRCRGGTAGAVVELELDAKNGALCLASDRHESPVLSPSATVSRAAHPRRAAGA